MRNIQRGISSRRRWDTYTRRNVKRNKETVFGNRIHMERRRNNNFLLGDNNP